MLSPADRILVLLFSFSIGVPASKSQWQHSRDRGSRGRRVDRRGRHHVRGRTATRRVYFYVIVKMWFKLPIYRSLDLAPVEEPEP